MSELKTYKMVDEKYCTDCVCVIPSEVYLKEDADKVIAEKDKELRHHKYKRCLAMEYVEWLKQMLLCNHPESILFRRADRRERKWKELAEKFKETK